MIFLYIGIAVVVIGALAKLFSAINGPRVAEAEKEKAEAVQREKTERIKLRTEARDKRRDDKIKSKEG